MIHGGWDFSKHHVVKLCRRGTQPTEFEWLGEQRLTIGKDYMAKPDRTDDGYVIWFAFIDEMIAAEFKLRFG